MMFTRCPSCRTAFRVTPEQLKARAGKVRCGHCNAVFNALETLEDAPPVETPSAPAAPAPAEAAAAAPEPTTEAGAGEPDVAAEPAGATHVGAGWSRATRSASISAGGTHVGAGLPATAPDSGAGPLPPAQIEPAPAPPRRRAFAWALAAIAMLALLGAQSVYVFRTELAALRPDLRPALEELCAALGCDIPLPSKPDLMSIESSDLHPDPKQGKLLLLAATLKNRAPFAQAYPHLELTLTDSQDQPLVRRVFAPQEYLAAGTDMHAGFAANGDLALSLQLEAAEVGATGYRLYLFYP